MAKQLEPHVSRFEKMGDGWYRVEVVDFEDRAAAVAFVRKTLVDMDRSALEFLVVHDHGDEEHNSIE